jgi:hypothetical protein
MTPSSPDQEPVAWRWWVIVTLLAALAVAASLLFPTARHQWAVSLFRQPTYYTVLSFNQPQALPATAVIDQPIRISFTIGNHEGHLVGYRYVISASNGGIHHVLGQAKRTIGAGARWTVTRVVRPDCHRSPCRIAVSLPGHPEQIDFLVTMVAKGG